MAQTQTDVERKRLQRERTAKHRAKVQAESANNLAANEQKSRDQFEAWRVAQRLVSPGECEAFQDAQTCGGALTVAREFLTALNQPDVQSGETLLDVERRVITAWCAVGAPLLNRNTLRFDEETGSTIDGFVFDFDGRWIALDGANEVIDVSTLPVIEVPEVEVSPPEIPAISNRADDPALRNYRTPEVVAICKAQQDRCDAEARRIGAANLQREIEKEKRFGVGYAYAE